MIIALCFAGAEPVLRRPSAAVGHLRGARGAESVADSELAGNGGSSRRNATNFKEHRS